MLKKKGQIATISIIIFLAIGLVLGALFFGGRDDGTGLTAIPLALVGDGVVLDKLTLTEDTTVTFSSQDFYSKGTSAGTAHRILKLGNAENIIVADDASKTASPNDEYIVLMGNITTNLVGGTDYYPVVATGVIPDKGTLTIKKDQYKVGSAGELTFTQFDSNGDTNTDEPMGANDEAKQEWKIEMDDNVCLGNPDTGLNNIASYTYNNTVFTKVVSLNVDGSEKTRVNTPNSVTSKGQHSISSYEFPVVCDNAQFRQKVLIKTLLDPTSLNNINITLSDVTWDFDADTLELISGVQDEDNNDIGDTDFIVGSLLVS